MHKYKMTVQHTEEKIGPSSRMTSAYRISGTRSLPRKWKNNFERELKSPVSD